MGPEAGFYFKAHLVPTRSPDLLTFCCRLGKTRRLVGAQPSADILQRSRWMTRRGCGTSQFKRPHHFSKSSQSPPPQPPPPLSHSLPLSFCQVTGQLMAEKLRYLSSFNQAPSHATATTKMRRIEGKKERKKKRRGGIKSLSAVMSKASIFTEQLGVSSQRSDVRIHYCSATANCFKVKVTDLTALYFKWQTGILVVFHRAPRWH